MIGPRSRIGVACLGVSMVLALGTIQTLAQDSAASKPAEKGDAKPEKKASSQVRRVPPYFGKIGLSTQQREKIYDIRGDYQAKIAEMQKQLDELKVKELTDCEAILTEPQKKLLDQERGAAKAKSKSARRGSDSDN